MSEQGYDIPEWTPADRLRKARLHKRLTQAELADRIGVSENTIGNYETGQTTNLRRIVLKQWALATGVPVEWLQWGVTPTGGPDGPSGLGSDPSSCTSHDGADLLNFPTRQPKDTAKAA